MDAYLEVGSHRLREARGQGLGVHFRLLTNTKRGACVLRISQRCRYGACCLGRSALSTLSISSSGIGMGDSTVNSVMR